LMNHEINILKLKFEIFKTFNAKSAIRIDSEENNFF